MSHLRRTLLLALLLALYLASSVRSMVGDVFRVGAFDPFVPAARALEQRIGARRFADALPLAIELDRAYPREPQIAFWLARVYHGLNDPRREAAAWERYIEVSAAPEEACPAIAEAQALAGRLAEALHAYERCATFDPDDTARLIDLGDAYARANRVGDALTQYRRARFIDPADPALAARIATLIGAQGDAQ